MNNKDIGLCFKDIFQKIEKCKNKNLEDLDLTFIQASVLIYLFSEKDYKNQRDIEKYFNLTNPTVNGILNRLESKGFITRQVSKLDARNKEIHLTDKSYKLDLQMKSNIKKFESKLINNITEEELNIFYNVIRKINNNIEGEDL